MMRKSWSQNCGGELDIPVSLCYNSKKGERMSEQVRPNFRYSVLARSITGMYGVSEDHHEDMRVLVRRHLGQMHPTQQTLMKKSYLSVMPMSDYDRVRMVTVRQAFAALLSTDERLRVASWREEKV